MSDSTYAAEGGTLGPEGDVQYQQQGQQQQQQYQQQAPPGPATGLQPFDPRSKSSRLAAGLSLAVPGLGQVYIGYYVRGFVLMGTVLLLGLFAGEAPRAMGPIPGFMIFFVWLFSAIDAGRMAALYNHAMLGAGGIAIPEDFELPALGGSIVGGGLLIVLGAVALSNTLWGISLDWVENWWPVLPLAIGGYLLARGVMDLQRDAPASVDGAGED